MDRLEAEIRASIGDKINQIMLEHNATIRDSFNLSVFIDIAVTAACAAIRFKEVSTNSVSDTFKVCTSTPFTQSDEYVCGERDCGLRWDIHEERPPCPKYRT